MKLSVIIPVYNCEKYLERNLDSVLRQRIDDGDELQIITVDDGSTDSSGSILDRYAKQHSNIQVLHQPNQGVSTARNNALDQADGDYIHFVDADDFLLYNNSYQKLLEILKGADTPIDVLRIKSVIFSENYELRLDRYTDLSDIVVEFDGSGREFCHQLLFAGYAWASIARRFLVEELKLRFNTNLRLNEDALFFLTLYNYARRVVLSNASIYGYYKHSESVTFTKDKQRLRTNIDHLFDTLPAFESVLDLYKDPFFKEYRMECHGFAVGMRLLKLPLSYKELKHYINRGFDCGIFPVGENHSGKHIEKSLGWLLKRPIMFWLVSLCYRYIFLPVVRPLILKFGRVLFE